MKKIVLSFMIMFSFLFLFSCEGQLNKKTETEVNISSKEDLIRLLEKYQKHDSNIAIYGDAAEGTEKSSDENSSNQDRDYSKTNTQVTGVDEADIVKTDGTYIYLPVRNKVLISKAYPVSEMNLTHTITYEDGFYPNSLYVDNDYLIVIGIDYNRDENYRYYYEPTSRIIIYDKTNYETPKDIIDVDGYITTTRKVNGELLVISNQYIYYNPKDTDSLKLPEVSINDTKHNMSYEDIHYQEGTYPNSFVSLLKFNLDNPNNHFDQYTYLGSANNVYVSQENVYVAQYIYHYAFFIEDDAEEPVTSESKSSDDDAVSPDEEGNTNGSTGDVISSDEEVVTTTEEKVVEENQTIVTKINYTDEQFGESKSVKVKGYVNNQFSMDEYQNTFRIATTSGNRWWGDGSSNNLYIYDENLELLSKVEGIAKNERIQSARFMGERIYLVTFRQIDPFFVIDVKDPRNPKILGELKIPGYSTYLHPYDENHIIGFGFDTTTVMYGDNEVTRITGIKMSMFDVEDPENPVALFNEILPFGEGGYAYSELSYNHKAMLFSKARNLIAFPLTFSSYHNEEGKYHYYRHQSYKVYQVDLENGFTFKTDITHFDTEKENGYQYGYQILRGIYIENNLYTVSYSKIQAHSLTTFEELNTLDLGFDPHHYYYWWGYPETDEAK
ncbi:beta-propeller domain-containing protein [Mycoplasmatota bacterium]|nr:beta-propeller domain-containing protein [Mycoplasmatota bacterium]